MQVNASTDGRAKGQATMKVVLASGNAGKLRELSVLLAPVNLVLTAQHELGISSPPETGSTFLENALLKARHASAQAGLAAIADDSGLVVPALGGEPGVHSARYAGENATDAANNRKLVTALAGVAQRTARFHCVLVFLTHADDPAPVLGGGVWRGEIIDTPRGDGGFGYDPHFLVPVLGKTAAELARAEKNRLSHRGQAARNLAKALADS